MHRGLRTWFSSCYKFKNHAIICIAGVLLEFPCRTTSDPASEARLLILRIKNTSRSGADPGHIRDQGMVVKDDLLVEYLAKLAWARYNPAPAYGGDLTKDSFCR